MLFFARLAGLIHVDWWVQIVLGINTIFWLGRYQLGLLRNLQHNEIKGTKKAAYHLGLLVLTPAIELLCTIPTLYALIRPPKAFEVTGK